MRLLIFLIMNLFLINIESEKIMTNAEFKTLCEKLGFTPQSLSKFLNLKSDRAPRYWSSPNGDKVPRDVVDKLFHLEDQLNRVINEAVNQIGNANHVVLLRYIDDADLWHYRPDMQGLPVSFHAKILQGVKDLSPAPVTITYLIPEAYEEWLTKHSLHDSESSRSAWATTTL